MQNFNFFQWIREGVRQSVLLGVSDAVEQLGVPEEADKSHPLLAGLLKDSARAPALTASAKSTKKTATRKRLGKSLKDISAETE